MSHPTLTRRGFLASALALLVTRARPLSATPHDACAHAGHRHRAGGPHPTPRPGITAAKVSPASRLADEPASVRTAFEEVRQVPEVVDGIRCQCGCADQEGHYSLLSCFEGEGMARHCTFCQGQGRMAFRLHREGKSLAEIRTAIEERYG